MQPRQYQQDTMNRVNNLLPKYPTLLVAPTGSGKTYMGTGIVNDYYQTNLGSPILWLAHRKELIDQAYKSITGFGLIDTGVIRADDPRTNPNAIIQVASIQTLVRRNIGQFGLVVIDEAHHATGDSYRNVLEANPSARILGLTATPFRLDGAPLGDIFKKLEVAADVDDLVKMGYLSEPVVFAPAIPDLSSVAKANGDYVMQQSSQVMMQPAIIDKIIKVWEAHGKGIRTVGFACNIEHAFLATNAFKKRGHKFELVSSKTPQTERDELFNDLCLNRIDGIWNCEVATEGFDLPELSVAILARPTASLGLHIQMIGRIMRACPGKTGALVIDAAGNHARHGFVTRCIKYSLTKKIQVSAGKGEALTKVCPKCDNVCSLNASECGCGHVFKVEKKLIDPDAEFNLIKATKIDIPDRLKMQIVWDRLVAQAELYKLTTAQLLRRFKDTFGRGPFLINGHMIEDPQEATAQQQRKFYNWLIKTGTDAGFKTGWASWQYRHSTGDWPKWTWQPKKHRDEILAKRKGGK